MLECCWCSSIAVAVVVILLIKWIINKQTFNAERKKLLKNRKEFKQWCEKTIEAVKEKISNDEFVKNNCERVTSTGAAELVDCIQKGTLRSLDVLHCFQAKALEAHSATNCIQYFFDNAEEAAAQIDSSSDKRGILCGLPISLKDHYTLKGYCTTVGCSSMANVLSEEDCAIVQTLKSQGAVPFVMTNVPQTLLSYQSHNPIHGETFHPKDPTRCPGGSSSGEGALVGFGGSPLGFGSDLGGSIRVPSSMCGCYGFKPTVERMGKKGIIKVQFGQTIVDETFGPITPTFDALIVAMRTLWNGTLADIDRMTVPLTFNNQIYNDTRKLRIGYYTKAGPITAVPAFQRAVMEVKALLEIRGHELVEWEPPFDHELPDMEATILTADGLQSYIEHITHDDMSPIINHFFGPYNLPTWKKYLNVISNLFSGSAGISGAMCGSFGLRSVYDWWKGVEELNILRYKYDTKWRETGLDAIIAPPFFTTAWLLRKCGEMSSEQLCLDGWHYAAMYNALDMPAGVMPVSTVTKQDVEDLKTYPLTDVHRRAVAQSFKGSEGLPVNIQVIASRYRDEYVFRVLREIEEGLRDK